MMVKWSIRIDIYGAMVYFAVCDHLVKGIEELKLPINSAEYKNCDAITLTIDKIDKNDRGYTDYYVVFEKPSNERPSTVAHECLHACNHILSDRGIYSTPEEDEVQAYLLGFIVDGYYKGLKKNFK